jgi:uncharacterized protein YqeY
MKDRDMITVSALRSTLAAIENAGAVSTPETATPVIGNAEVAGAVLGVGAADVARRELSEEQVAEIVRTEIAERHEAATAFERAGKHDRAQVLRAEVEALVGYLGT